MISHGGCVVRGALFWRGECCQTARVGRVSADGVNQTERGSFWPRVLRAAPAGSWSAKNILEAAGRVAGGAQAASKLTVKVYLPTLYAKG